MNLKRGVLLSVAALTVGSVGVLACTRERVATAGSEAASVEEACRHDNEAPSGDTAAAFHRGDRGGQDVEDPGWFPEGPGADPRDPRGGAGPQEPQGPPPGWDGREGPDGPQRGWGEERGRGGRGRGGPGEARGRRGHRGGGRRGGHARGQRADGRGQGPFGGMDREMRPWLRELLEQIMALAQGGRGRDQGPPGV